jgi:hypothetical protein
MKRGFFDDVNDLKWCFTILYSELLAAALRYRYPTQKAIPCSLSAVT